MPKSATSTAASDYLASLGMYDHPWFTEVNDRLWTRLREYTFSLEPPLALNRQMPLKQQWNNDKLFFSQTCGYPYITAFRHKLTLLGTPTYSHEGCETGLYSSFLVSKRTAATDLGWYHDRRLAANSTDSLSGLVALEITLAESGYDETFFSDCLLSGGHINSMRLVAQGDADICCIDAVTWALACQTEATLTAQLQIVGQSPYFPALPFVTSSARTSEFTGQLQKALQSLCDDPLVKADLGQLGLVSISAPDHLAYENILDQYAKVDPALKGNIAREFRST